MIADFNATELMLRGMIKKVKTSGSLFAPSLRMVICIPSGSTNVEYVPCATRPSMPAAAKST